MSARQPPQPVVRPKPAPAAAGAGSGPTVAREGSVGATAPKRVAGSAAPATRVSVRQSPAPAAASGSSAGKVSARGAAPSSARAPDAKPPVQAAKAAGPAAGAIVGASGNAMVSTATAELLAEAAAMLAFARGGGGGGGAGAAAALAKGVGKQAGAGQDAAAAERKAPVGVGESAPAVGTLRGLRSLSEVAAAAGLSPTTFPSTAGKGSGAGGSADAAVSALARARLETFRRASVEQLRARLEGDGAGGDDGGEEEEGEDVDDEDEEEEDGEADEDDEDDEADALDGTDASPEGTAAAGPLLDIGAIIRHRAAASAAAAVAAAGTGMTGTGTAGAAKGRVSRPLPSAPVRRSAGDVAALSEVARGDWAQLFCAPSARSSPSLSLSSPASASAEATAQAWERAVEGVLGDAASRRALAAFSRDVLCVSAAAHTPKQSPPAGPCPLCVERVRHAAAAEAAERAAEAAAAGSRFAAASAVAAEGAPTRTGVVRQRGAGCFACVPCAYEQGLCSVCSKVLRLHTLDRPDVGALACLAIARAPEIAWPVLGDAADAAAASAEEATHLASVRMGMRQQLELMLRAYF